MPDLIPFPTAHRREPAARLQEIATYGTVGPLTVTLVRRTDAMAGLIHVVVTGPPVVGVETVATLADDAKGRSEADFAAVAVLRALELAETAFTCRPGAC